MAFNIEPYSASGVGLGEGPHWSPETKRLYYVDIFAGIAATIDDITKEVKVLVDEKPENVSAVLPVEGDVNKVVVSIGAKIFLVNTLTGEKTLLNQLDKEGVRFNDAKCDPRGRLWIGTIGDVSDLAAMKPELGSLYVRTSDGKLVEKFDKVSGSNGITWSPDAKSLYYIDTFKRFIYKFDYDIETANIGNSTILVDMNKDDAFLAEEFPDGMTIDISGNLWVAMFNGGRVVNIDGQTGKVIESIQLPTSMTTSACFGGPNLDQLFVTSIKDLLDEDRKAKEPLAGFIFKVTSKNPNFKGFKANFALKL